MAYIQRERNDHIRVENVTGADLAQYEFTVNVPWAAVADEAIADGAVGSMHVEEGIQIQVDNLVATEDTFATVGQDVWFDPTTGDFSDTDTAGYFHVGYLITAKDANGMIVFEKTRYATLSALV